jgi:hypothetical protein
MWGRALAALGPGFVLAAALVGLACWLPPGPWQATVVPGLVAFVPAWTLLAVAAFAFRDAARAWWWLGGGAVVATLGFSALRVAGWIE